MESKRVGLSNPTGHNNCFLNVVVQGLWRVQEFRAHVLSEQCSPSPLQALFIKMASAGDGHTLSPQELRDSLQQVNWARFRPGAMADVSETFEEILQHLDSLVGEKDRRGFSIRDFFDIRITHASVCSCGDARKDEITSFEFHVYAADIVQHANAFPMDSFEEALRETVNGLIPTCPHESHAKQAVSTLSSVPHAFTVSVVWMPEPGGDFIRTFAHLIRPSLSLHKVFDFPQHCRFAFELVGMACFYGNHYVAFTRDAHPPPNGDRVQANGVEGATWSLIDDASIRTVGSWLEVVHEIGKAKYQPVMLMYTHAPRPGNDRNRHELWRDNSVRSLLRDFPTVRIPCEYCDAPIAVSSLNEHQQQHAAEESLHVAEDPVAQSRQASPPPHSHPPHPPHSPHPPPSSSPAASHLVPSIRQPAPHELVAVPLRYPVSPSPKPPHLASQPPQPPPRSHIRRPPSHSQGIGQSPPFQPPPDAPRVQRPSPAPSPVPTPAAVVSVRSRPSAAPSSPAAPSSLPSKPVALPSSGELPERRRAPAAASNPPLPHQQLVPTPSSSPPQKPSPNNPASVPHIVQSAQGHPSPSVSLLYAPRSRKAISESIRASNANRQCPRVDDVPPPQPLHPAHPPRESPSAPRSGSRSRAGSSRPKPEAGERSRSARTSWKYSVRELVRRGVVLDPPQDRLEITVKISVENGWATFTLERERRQVGFDAIEQAGDEFELWWLKFRTKALLELLHRPVRRREESSLGDSWVKVRHDVEQDGAV